jgi:ribosome-binding factor A
MPSRRQERVSKRIIQETVEALRNLKHVKLGFVTVTRCEVSPDLRHATIFISVFGSDEERERTLQIIRNNASKLRGMIGRPLAMKMTPQLHFEFDDTIETADRMSRLITDARKTDSNPEPLTPEEVAELAAQSKNLGKRRKVYEDDPEAGDEDFDPFEEARQDVEDELLSDDDDDEAWKPINLDELPE